MAAGSIARVRSYTASPVETCDRCAAAIKFVTVVTFRDGVTQRFGSECINRVLAGETSLAKLVQKNLKLDRKYEAWVDVLSRAPELMPRGREYYGSGMYFLADDSGADIFVGTDPARAASKWIWHPMPDWTRNQAGDRYVQEITPEAYRAKAQVDIDAARAWVESQRERIGLFLARALAKVNLTPAGR